MLRNRLQAVGKTLRSRSSQCPRARACVCVCVCKARKVVVIFARDSIISHFLDSVDNVAGSHRPVASFLPTGWPYKRQWRPPGPVIAVMARIRNIGVVLLLVVGLAAAEIQNKGWWRHMVFYQIYPRSFMDFDNDGVGDLKGIQSKLDHFNETGIGGIWLSPINRSPMVDFGYDISDFEDIDEAFGTLQDFENLVQAAKKKGLKVVMDLVPNHSSDQHYWFQQSLKGVGKYKDYYIWADPKPGNKTPNNWISVFGGPAWTYAEERKQYYFHQFERRQPDLNYSNPHVQEEMKNIIEFWLHRGVDGFRIDAVPHLFEANITLDEPRTNTPNVTDQEYSYLNHIYTKDQPATYTLVKSWRDIVDNYANLNNEDEKVIMTEAYTDLTNTTKFYEYGSHIPFNFKFIMEVNSTSPPADFKKIIDDWMAHTPADAVPNWVIGNHDRSRTPSRYPGRADQLTMLEMILPGVAVTYYGEEIAMVDKRDISWEDTQDPQGCNAGKVKYQEVSRDPVRTPFQWDATANAGFSKAAKTWLPVHDNHEQLNLKAQKEAKNSHYKLYQSLVALRKSSSALKSGGLETFVLNSTVLGVVRKSDDETLTLLVNFKTTDRQRLDVSKYHSGDTTVILIDSDTASLTEQYDAKVGEKVDVKNVLIPPKAAIILRSTSGALTVAASSLLALMSFIAVTIFGRS